MATQGTAYEQQKRRTVADTFCLDRVEIYKCTIMLNDHFDSFLCPAFKMYQCFRAAIATESLISHISQGLSNTPITSILPKVLKFLRNRRIHQRMWKQGNHRDSGKTSCKAKHTYRYNTQGRHARDNQRVKELW
jgi:hypothetical protein